MFLYIDYFSMSVLICFIFFFPFYCSSLQSYGSTGCMENAVFICVCLLQWSSLLQAWCSLMCLRVSVSPFMSWIPPPRPTLSPKRALPRLSVTPSHSSSLSLFHITGQNQRFYHICQLSMSSSSLTPLAQIEPILYSLCWHNSFIWQQSNATPKPSTPSSGCLS